MNTCIKYSGLRGTSGSAGWMLEIQRDEQHHSVWSQKRACWFSFIIFSHGIFIYYVCSAWKGRWGCLKCIFLLKSFRCEEGNKSKTTPFPRNTEGGCVTCNRTMWVPLPWIFRAFTGLFSWREGSDLGAMVQLPLHLRKKEKEKHQRPSPQKHQRKLK